MSSRCRCLYQGISVAGDDSNKFDANDTNEHESNLSIDDSEQQRGGMAYWNYRSGWRLLASRAAVPKKSSSGLVERGSITAEVGFAFIRVIRVQFVGTDSARLAFHYDS